MNRPIKFRYRYEQTNKLTGEKIIVTRIYDMSQIEDGIAKVYFDCEKLISRDEFTGLHDKNGKEIFEGDILCTPDEENEYYYSKVIWGDEIAGWATSTNNFIEPLSELIEEQPEIIGDIFTTPELLD